MLFDPISLWFSKGRVTEYLLMFTDKGRQVKIIFGFFRLLCDAMFIRLTHWGRVKHIGVSNLITIGSDNDVSPGRGQTIVWTNAGIVSIGSGGIHFSEILIESHTFSFSEVYFKISSGKWRPFVLGLNVLMVCIWYANHKNKCAQDGWWCRLRRDQWHRVTSPPITYTRRAKSVTVKSLI